MSDSANIFSSGDDKRRRLSEEQLQAYLEGRLNAEEQHEVELWLAEESMESDALEGLQKLSTVETKQSVNKLNHHLRKQLAGKKKKRSHLYKDNQWTLVAIFIVILLCVLAYVVMRLLKP